MNRYNDRAQLVFHFAREEGLSLGHTTVEPEHLLLSVVREEGRDSKVLGDFEMTLKKLRCQVEVLLGRGEGLSKNKTLAVTPRARRVMDAAGSEAGSLDGNVITPDPTLLAIICEGGVA